MSRSGWAAMGVAAVWPCGKVRRNHMYGRQARFESSQVAQSLSQIWERSTHAAAELSSSDIDTRRELVLPNDNTTITITIPLNLSFSQRLLLQERRLLNTALLNIDQENQTDPADETQRE